MEGPLQSLSLSLFLSLSLSLFVSWSLSIMAMVVDQWVWPMADAYC